MPAFTGTLNSNLIFASLYNMIISQQVFADNVYDVKSSLVDMSRVDGSMYGDQKLFYATNILKSVPWGADADAPNLLQLHRPPAPECQAIVMNVFRNIPLTVDYYLTKQAWIDESAFSSFNSVMLGWIRETKRAYDATTFNAFIGTAESNIGKQEIKIPFIAEASGETNVETEARNRLNAQTIAAKMSDLMVELEDLTDEYNDYGFKRSYNSDDLIAVWNSEAVNRINKIDIPMIYNSLSIDKKGEYTLPARYFGTVNTSGGTAPASNASIRSLIEKDYTVGGTTIHVFAGDLLPGSAVYLANETYTQDNTILFKIMHKRSVPYMSAFEVGTSFFNPLSLTENHYLIFGHNTIEYLKNYPFITVRSETN